MPLNDFHNPIQYTKLKTRSHLTAPRPYGLARPARANGTSSRRTESSKRFHLYWSSISNVPRATRSRVAYPRAIILSSFPRSSKSHQVRLHLFLFSPRQSIEGEIPSWLGPVLTLWHAVLDNTQYRQDTYSMECSTTTADPPVGGHYGRSRHHGTRFWTTRSAGAIHAVWSTLPSWPASGGHYTVDILHPNARVVRLGSRLGCT